VYDVTNRASFENVPQWKKDLDEFVGIIPFILMGNKIDLERAVSKKRSRGSPCYFKRTKFFRNFRQGPFRCF